MDKTKKTTNRYRNLFMKKDPKQIVVTLQRLWMTIMLAAISSTALATTTTISYYHNDHLGTPQVMTDENQNIVWQASYDPFGKANITTETVINNVRFPGQYFDQETNLHYNYFRTYDPSIGRYITSDPIGLDGGISTYAYVGGNPLMYTDPYGLDAFLASRPTLGGANHMFVVYGADANGNGGTVRSFGMQDGGKLGEVNLTTAGFSEGTLQKDMDFWSGKSSGLEFTRIDASDCDVKEAADNLLTPWRYTFPPIYGLPLPTSGHLTMNSNTAAQAVANQAAGTPVPAPSAYHPGAENAELLRFR